VLLRVVALLLLAFVAGCSADAIDFDEAGVAIGESYPMSVYTHCGITFLRFAGLDWAPERVVGDPGPVPDGNSNLVEDWTVDGHVVVVDERTLHFIAADTPVMVFHPTSELPPPCA
jgi:hypothetical protein